MEERAPRKSKAREEAADSGEKVKLLSEFSDRRARYILRKAIDRRCNLSCSLPECHVIVHFYKVLGSFVQPTAGDPQTKVTRRSLRKAFCICCQGGKVISSVMTVPMTVIYVVAVLVVMMVLMFAMFVTIIMTISMVMV